MKKMFLFFCSRAFIAMSKAQNNTDSRNRLFDDGWRFTKDSTVAADATDFDDSKWRTVDLPHDWSIEDLPGQSDSVVGPFTTKSIGATATGYTVGGIGWYRKHFTP